MVKGIMAKNRSRTVIPLLRIAILIGTAWFGSLCARPQVKAAAQSKTSVESTTSYGSATATGDWTAYDGEPNGDHYSVLKQINRENVSKLKLAWTFDTKEVGGLQDNPLILDGVLYAFTPSRKVIALDGASGKLLWTFDSGLRGRGRDRGVAYWADGQDRRILAGIGSFLYAINLSDGKPIPSFGENGRVDLRKGLGRDYLKQSIDMDSPGIVYHDLIIVGDSEPEDYPAPPGDIRAYNIRTGNLQWTFHTIPHPGEFGYDTWPKDAWKYAGAANNWAGMALDAERGIVYVPTGSAVPDFYGADRVGNDLFADTLIALNAETGQRIWHFQGVHHDIWDRDFPSPPALLTVVHDGKRVDAVAQTTKSGFIFLFNRATGEPLFPIVEKSYPPSTAPGEVTSPTQPLPTAPLPFARQAFTRDMVTNRTPEAHQAVLNQFDRFISNGQFLPFTVDKITIMLPGTGGGGEWGGPAIDPASGVIYVNSNEMPRLYSLAAPPHPGSEGERVYQDRCSSCHGVNRAGSPPAIPSLNGIAVRLSDAEIEQTIQQGRGRMPPFPDIDDKEAKAVIQYLQAPSSRRGQSGEDGPEAAAPGNGGQVFPEDPLKTIGSLYFLDPDGYPAVVPPWGTLNAIDLNTGKYLWKIPFGEYPELAAKGMHDTGSQNYGGPIVTAGGVLFIGATLYDHKFRAFNAKTGKLLWEATLPYSGSATPATYSVKGKQYVVIAAGGSNYGGGPTGGTYVAYTLP
jgi:quinoprotein glucose dehydrogenase